MQRGTRRKIHRIKHVLGVQFIFEEIKTISAFEMLPMPSRWSCQTILPTNFHKQKQYRNRVIIVII
jgi:hypothetical protein